MQFEKKKILLISLGAVAALIFLRGMMALSAAKHKSSESTNHSSAEDPSKSVASSEISMRLPRQREGVAYGRNPFTHVEVSTPMAPSANAYILNGIMWDNRSPQAIINNQIVGRGGRIGRDTVVDILPNKVILNDGERDLVLEVDEY